MNKMTLDQCVELFRGGNLVVIAEMRGYTCEDRQWRDKATGRAVNGTFLVHNVEVGPKAMSLAERLPEGVTEKNYNWPFKKGESVLIEVEGMEVSKGHTILRGEVKATVGK